MSNLLKSKAFKVGGLVIAVAVMLSVGALAASAQTTTVYASAYTYSGVMKAGMSGPGISTLQAALNQVLGTGGNIVVDGKFGPATLGAVKMFQMSHGLTADGVVGPMTGAALAQASQGVIVIPTGSLPAGCTSTSGFSTVTGMPCTSVVSYPAGCTSSAGYSPTTGVKCDGMISINNNNMSESETSATDENDNEVTGPGPRFLSTSASLISVDGADNDLGAYTIEVDVSAFGDDQFISQSGSVAYAVQIQDASNGAILTPTTISTVVSSTADTEGGSYRIDEGNTETFTFTITVNPDPADEGKNIRVKLSTITSGPTAGVPTGNIFTITAGHPGKNGTAGVTIPD